MQNHINNRLKGLKVKIYQYFMVTLQYIYFLKMGKVEAIFFTTVRGSNFNIESPHKSLELSYYPVIN